jgi:hypothetical protein
MAQPKNVEDQFSQYRILDRLLFLASHRLITSRQFPRAEQESHSALISITA